MIYRIALALLALPTAAAAGRIRGMVAKHPTTRRELCNDGTTVITGQIVDIHNNCEIYPGEVKVENGVIEDIQHKDDNDSGGENDVFILPGFIDAHVHIESSLLVPSEFARLAVPHGVVATVSDPHEIANVLGVEGVRYMIENAEEVPFHFFFGAPSCVPATTFETAGAEITVDDIIELFQDDRIKMLSEMMNYPGVIWFNDPIVLAKIAAAVAADRPVDGHIPGQSCDDTIAYINHGITTDHETYGFDEAICKIDNGMKVQIREGSGGKNFDVLHPIIDYNPDMTMFCMDDAHPDLLFEHGVDYHVRESIELGHDFCDVLKIASKNPVDHYDLPVGLLRKGDSADFILVDNLADLNVQETWIQGQLVASQGESLIQSVENVTAPNNFGRTSLIGVPDIYHDYEGCVRVIAAEDGALVTGEEFWLTTDPGVQKIVVVNRYDNEAPPAVAYVKGFGLAEGAIASSVAHDSHNIVAVGATDEDIINAVNSIIASKGGLAVSRDGVTETLALPVAGIMSNADAFEVKDQYIALATIVKDELLSPLSDPFMMIAFMALLVIPNLKLSDQGLFDGSTFEFVPVEVPSGECP